MPPDPSSLSRMQTMQIHKAVTHRLILENMDIKVNPGEISI